MNTPAEHESMVREQIVGRGIRDPRVIDAMRAVPREEFVPEESRGLAYEDHPLVIEHDQTISQPYIVALMTELLKLPDHAEVLEIGAGSGYQTAILAHIAQNVCALERIPGLADSARQRLESLGFSHIDLRAGDGFQGWPEPDRKFDGILVACAADHVPENLVALLKPGARMVIPIGSPGGVQDLTVVIAHPPDPPTLEIHSKVRFVPML